MQLLTPYLTFDGQCEIALAFYADVFNGRITSLRRFDEAPMQVAEADKARVLHAEFAAEGIRFMSLMACPDALPSPVR